MELTWGTLVLIMFAGLVAWFWQDSLRVRERANAAAMEACGRLALQFLDGTVAFTRLRLVRDAGQLRLRRTYIFDYTAHSIERLQGFVVLLGMHVESVGFARNETERPIATAIRSDVVTEQPGASIADSPTAGNRHIGSGVDEQDSDSKVLDLNEWRRTRKLH
jgi:hypothetical protein